MSSKFDYRWYQLRLRTLLLVVTLICLGPGAYIAYQQRRSRDINVAAHTLESLGARLFTDQNLHPRSIVTRVIFGDNAFENVTAVQFDPSFAEGRQITDVDLRHLKSLPKINYLVLQDCKRVTDEGLREISRLPNLEYLYLSGTPVTDEGLVPMKNVTTLKQLSLTNTRVTDAGLIHLIGLSKLDELWLDGTCVTERGVEQLRRDLPNCFIVQ